MDHLEINRTNQASYIIRIIMLAIPLSIAVAGLSILFLMGIKELGALFYRDISLEALSKEWPMYSHYWLFLILPLGGLIVGLLTYYLMPGHQNVGLAGVIEAVHERQANIALREGVGVGLVSVFSIASGASVGRYGPAVHIGASLGSRLANWFKMDRVTRLILLACGVAAAISASFNAPFAGVVFAHEVVLRNYHIRGMTPVAIASIIAYYLGQQYNDVLYGGLKVAPINQIDEIGLLIFIGILAALIAVALMRLLVIGPMLTSKIKIDPRLKPVLGGLLLASIAFFFPQVLGLSTFAIQDIFNGAIFTTNWGMWLLLAILVAKFLSIVISFSFGFNGGLLGPAMTLGAMMAAFVATSYMNVVDVAIPGFMNTMVFVGMGSVISAVFGAPIATTILLLEFTGSYNVAPGVLVGIVVSNFISYRLFSRSFFDFMLRRKGVDIRGSKEKSILKTVRIGDVMQQDVVSVTMQAKRDEILSALELCQRKQQLFVVERNVLRGWINPAKLAAASSEVVAADIVENVAIWIHVDQTFLEATESMGEKNMLAVPVLKNDGTQELVGFLSSKQIVDRYRQLFQEIREEEQE